MRQTPPNAVAIAETNPRKQLIGLLGGMKDGYVASFNWEGIKVQRVGDSIGVSPEGSDSIEGGRLLVESASVKDMANWVENKSELYGDN